MNRRPHSATRSATLLPYTTLFRSFNQVAWLPGIPIDEGGFGQTSVDIPRYVGEFDCASAPGACILVTADQNDPFGRNASVPLRSEAHTSEPQSLMRTSYAVLCLKKKHNTHTTASTHEHRLLT